MRETLINRNRGAFPGLLARDYVQPVSLDLIRHVPVTFPSRSPPYRSWRLRMAAYMGQNGEFPPQNAPTVFHDANNFSHTMNEVRSMPALLLPGSAPDLGFRD